MPATVLSRTYDDLLSLTLDNVRGKLEDIVSTANKVFFWLKKSGAYSGTDNLGHKYSGPVMYSFPTPRVYSGYDDLDVTPHDGITRAFYDWRQAAQPITISRIEERQNAGSEVQILDLLAEKVTQSKVGFEDLFGRMFLQGQAANGGSLTSAYVDPTTGRTFFEPIGSLIDYTPTDSRAIGEINQSTEAKWQNVTNTDASTTYAGLLKNIRKFWNDCSKGPGGGPDVGIADQGTYEVIEAALAAAHQNPSYKDADIPYDNWRLKGATVMWDEFVGNAVDDNATQQDPDGTLYFLNSKFFGVKYDSQTNFITTPFQKPENQDAKTAHIMWYGLTYTTNRRKLGVMSSIDKTIAA